MILNSTSDQSQGGQGTPFPPANSFEEETRGVFFLRSVCGGAQGASGLRFPGRGAWVKPERKAGP